MRDHDLSDLLPDDLVNEISDAEPDYSDLQAALRSAIDDAVDYIDNTVEPERQRARDYYHEQPFGTEQEGRSEAIVPSVRNTEQQLLPSLLRIFCSGTRTFEYLPRGIEDVATAELLTDLINDVVLDQDNNRFEVLSTAFKDALRTKTGIVKWWWDETVRTRTEHYGPINQMQAEALRQQPDVEVISEAWDVDATQAQDPASAMMAATGSLTLRRTVRTGRARIAAIPPEEFLISPDAKSVQDSPYVGHRVLRYAGDLIAEFPEHRDLIEEHAGDDEEGGAWGEAVMSRRGDRSLTGISTSPDPSMQRVRVVESYIRFDSDDDGVPELHRVISIGDEAEILSDEIVDEVPFALFCPDPEPHQAIGNSAADWSISHQYTASHIQRAMLDSLASSIYPRTVAVMQELLNPEDLLDNAPGAVIRVRSNPAAVSHLAEPFVGQQALAIQQYLDQQHQTSTGVTAASQGLDADVLQSTTKAAVDLAAQGANQRLELIARYFAEGGMRRLAEGLLRLVVAHPDAKRVVRLKNTLVEIDPAQWSDIEMDVSINVGLGRDDNDERFQTLSFVLQQQVAVMQQLGPQNPLVTLPMMRKTMADMLALKGVKDATPYFAQLPPNFQMPAPQPPPDPNAGLVQVEIAKAQTELEVARAKLELQRQEMLLKADLERDRLDAEVRLKAAEIAAKYQQQVDVAGIKADVDRDRHLMETVAQMGTVLPPQPAQPPMPPQAPPGPPPGMMPPDGPMMPPQGGV